MRFLASFGIALLQFAALDGAAHGTSDNASFEPLGDLPGGRFFSTPADISPDGSVVDGEMTGLGGPVSKAQGVSSGGEIVVGTFFPNPPGLVHAFQWSAERDRWIWGFGSQRPSTCHRAAP